MTADCRPLATRKGSVVLRIAVMVGTACAGDATAKAANAPAKSVGVFMSLVHVTREPRACNRVGWSVVDGGGQSLAISDLRFTIWCSRGQGGISWRARRRLKGISFCERGCPWARDRCVVAVGGRIVRSRLSAGCRLSVARGQL